MRNTKILALYFLALGILAELVLLTTLVIDRSIQSQFVSAQSRLVSTLSLETGQDSAPAFEIGTAGGYPPPEGTLIPFEDDAHAPGSEPADSDPGYPFAATDTSLQSAGLSESSDLDIPRGSEPSDSDGYPGPGDGGYSDTSGSDAPDPTDVPPTDIPPAVPSPPQPTATLPAPTSTAPQLTATQPAPTAALPAATATQPAPAPTLAAGAVRELVSVHAAAAPSLDGAGGDAAWASAPALSIETQGGANASATRVLMRSVYDAENVYFLLTWADPTQSWLRLPWEMQPNGDWDTLSSPNSRDNDENAFYEDKLALFWPVNSAVAQGFASSGCGGACHAGENPQDKPYGNMYTAQPGELWDLWQWKSVRNAGQMDDQYLDSDAYTKERPAAGFHPDPDSGGGYRDNRAEGLPEFMAPGGGDRSAAPGFILDSEKTAFDAGLFQPGDRLPGVITTAFQGDRGDIRAGWKYAAGAWTLEISRKRITGSQVDVQFDDLSRVYTFGLATFDNAQVRHAAQEDAVPFRFQP